MGLLMHEGERGQGILEGQTRVSPGCALLRGLKVRHVEAGGTLIFLGHGQSVKEPPGHKCPVAWCQAAGTAACSSVRGGGHPWTRLAAG